MLKDRHQYYIDTDAGDLLLFNEDNNTFFSIPLNIETGGIKSLYLDKNYLWIGTQRKGILVLNKKTNEIIIVKEENGLPNKVIYSILGQKDRYVWVSTNKGICQIDKEAVYQNESNTINQYLNYSNGLINNEFYTGAYHKDENGIMYFGGIDGVN
ncbi:MAG: ligand-binding sensor domain-containing protein [Saprospiraceae bacterium]|jgi:ligand-binding sensor domain-containing protein